MRVDEFSTESSLRNRVAVIAARVCLRSSMWFATVYWRHQKRGIGPACIRAISVHAVGAVLMCARAVGLLLVLLDCTAQRTNTSRTMDVPIFGESAPSEGKT